jgi:hypothetical protein
LDVTAIELRTEKAILVANTDFNQLPVPLQSSDFSDRIE